MKEPEPQFTEEDQEKVRLGFYRRMNVFEFEDGQDQKSKSDESREDSKLEELRAAVKRPTFSSKEQFLVGESRLQKKSKPQRFGDVAVVRRHQSYYDKLKEKKTLQSTDMINFIDWNERRHRVLAQETLRKNALAAS